MWGRKGVIRVWGRGCFLFILLVLSLYPTTVVRAGEAGRFPIPPAGSWYHGVFPGGSSGEEDDVTPDQVSDYEQAAGKKAAWVYFSHNWYKGHAFPAETVNWIRKRGSVPFIRLMLRDQAEQDRANQRYTLSRILAGDFDPDFQAWAKAARDSGGPLMVEYGTEMNGQWFPWNGLWNGGGEKNGYGDPQRADGPERFRDAYRHIIKVMRDAGASNILWVFHVNDGDHPSNDWNRLEQYYPGSDSIDVLGVSVYGAQSPQDKEWPAFRSGMDEVYPRLAKLDPAKPILVLEMGVTGRHPKVRKADWTQNALTDLMASRWPKTAGFAWWNEAWQNDDNGKNDTNMRVQDDPETTKVFQELVGKNPKVLDRLVIR